jgi:thiol-disulfide isomerase/thioredoxin/Tfp pilus assembly protein PilF
MKVMKKVIALLFLVMVTPLYAVASPQHVPAPAAQAAVERAKALDTQKQPADALAAFIEAIEADPDFLAAHEQLEESMSRWRSEAYQQKDPKPKSQANEMRKTVDLKYKEWERRFPDSVGIPYGMGVQLEGRENPGARPYLLKAAARDPNNAKIYSMLSFDAERWGDKKASLEYMHKAALLDPHNPDYAFYYASALNKTDPSQGEAALFDVPKRFPTSERGAQALYWLAVEAPDDAKRIAILEHLRQQFPPEKFSWSSGGMSDLFDAYLRVDPLKAGKLAQEMQGTKGSKEWVARVAFAQTYIQVNQKVAGGKPDDAVALLDKLSANPRSSNAAMLVRLKAQVMIKAGQLQGAYASLLKQQAKWPEDATRVALESAGKQLSKTAAQVHADLKRILDANAKIAPPFNLQQYGSAGTVSLASLRGKAVLLTFWFPGCGPCRAEFPHFEAVMHQFREKDVVYLGINVQRDQDEYVLPFMAKTQYSFLPLKSTPDKEIGGKESTEYQVRGEPTNFVIDRTGRIVYRDFMIDDSDGESVVKHMIESVL